MFSTISIITILTIIIFFIGFYFKSENENLEDSNSDLYYKYIKLKSNNFNRYFRKIKSIIKKINKGKKVQPY